MTVFDMDRPCENCPYRTDAPRQLWHPDEFRKVRASEQDPVMGAMFDCHKGKDRLQAEHRLCVGWLLDQKKRNVPSIQLRLLLMNKKEASALFERISARGLKLFSSIAAMCRANGVRP